MKLVADEYTQAVNALHREVFSDEILGLLRRIAGRGDAPHFIAILVAQERLTNQSDEEAVQLAGSKLEALAATAKTLACILMASLWPLANDLYLHEVCDSIDLWIFECDR